MPSATPLITTELLEDFFDPRSLARGQVYAAEGRITMFEESGKGVRAVCLGSGDSAYIVRIKWTQLNGEWLLDDQCSCPIGGGCKHCVATLLTSAKRSSAPNLDLEFEEPREDWRKALAGLASLNEQADAQPVELALQFSVLSRPASRYTPTGTTTVEVRPMRRSHTGKWVKTGATWRDINSRYSWELKDADPDQVGALRSIIASATQDTYYQMPSTVSLGLGGSELLHHIRRAAQRGVSLIGDKRFSVELSDEMASPVVDIVANESGALTLNVDYAIEGEVLSLPAHLSGPIGNPAHGLWVMDRDVLRLHRTRTAIPQAIANLIASGPVYVPSKDADEVLDRFQPILSRYGTVTSSDQSVSLATNEFQSLVLKVERQSLDSASIRWAARYTRGNREVDHLLVSFGNTGRDRDAESKAVEELNLPATDDPHDMRAVRLVNSQGKLQDLTLSGTSAIMLFTEVIPWLQSGGQVIVDITDPFEPLREATQDPLIALSVGDSPTKDDNDWFDLHVEVSVDGEEIDFATLFTALVQEQEALILPSGTWLWLDKPEFNKLRDLIEEARGLAEPSGSGVARVNRFQASWWEELAALGVVTQQSERWAKRVEQMGSLSMPEPLDPPAELQATLRHYQQEGYEWLSFLHRNQLGGILADDMGLGKTIQTLTLCLQILETNPDAKFLVVAPTSVVENWAREAAHFAPSIAVRTVHGTEARRGEPLQQTIGDASLVVTSYALLRLEFEAYDAYEWDLLLLDEAQFVKNHQSKTYRCVRRLNANSKIAITGTPLENSLMDLWSLLSITAPGLYPDPTRFSSTYRKPIEKGEAPELLATLKRRVAPLMRRRTKDEVLKELPPKIEQTVEVELNARHSRIYQTQLQLQRQKVLGLVGDMQKNRFEILKSLTLLRQLALDPGLVDEADDHVGSAKLDRLLDDLTQVVAEGHRALVFSQYTRFLARVRSRLDNAGIEYSYLDGRTRNRQEAISNFKDGGAPVFVISLKAGGFGLNLTEADYCFVLDPWWNPATETQAVDRAHRIGQENPVVVYRYVSTNTIEEKVMELKARKADLFSSVMDADGSLAGPLSEDDIRGLFELT